MPFYKRIEYLIEEKRKSLDFRSTSIKAKELLDLSGNDYLCLSKDERLTQAAKRAITQYGTSSSGSPVVSGYLEIHQELENFLSEWINIPNALLWSSGFSANNNIMASLPQKGDLVIADRLMHYSALKGAQESGAKLLRFKHNDLENLEYLLNKYNSKHPTIFVLSESLYSMDGDIPDLLGIAELKKRFDFIWILDEAHAMGWYGSGLAAKYGVSENIDILITTLGKSLASQGACSLFQNKALRDYCVNFAKEFIYTTYPSPANTAAALEAGKIIRNELSSEQSVWQTESMSLKRELKTIFKETKINDSPIVPIILGSRERVFAAGKELRESGILMGVIRPPSVPEGASRLRLSMDRLVNARELSAKLIPILRKYAS